MANYAAPLKDMRFVIHELARLDEVATWPGFEECSADLADAVLNEAGRFGAEVLAPLDRSGDLEGAVLENGVVRTPAGFSDAYKQFAEGGWAGMPADPEYGGQGLPWLIATAANEIWTSANMAFALGPNLAQSAAVLMEQYASQEQRDRYLEKIVTGEWTATMNLTEPQAGSDLGRIRTKAVKDGDHYRLTGQKIFITYGEQDWTDNIVHFVLARLPDAPEGTRGLSLFLVPKILLNEDGSLGPRNDLRCVSLEEKLGIHASPTCVMSYGDDGGAVGYLVGKEHHGLEGMFVMMNYTRLSVGLQGIGVGERAYQQALAYAHERVQGRGADGTEGVAIISHPDVRRMILTIKALTEAGRALALYTARCLDASNHHPDETERARNLALVGLLTPIVKAWISDNGIATASLNIQVHGGAGFIEETGAAQLYRDSRIAAIYEGTNGIQAADLVGRKVAREAGATARALIAEMTRLDEELGRQEGPAFVAMRRHLGDGIVALGGATDWLVDTAPDDPERVMAGAAHYLRMFGAVCGGWLMAKSAIIAAGKLATGDGDKAFFEAKIATARFFAEQILVDVPGDAAKFVAGADPVLAFADEAP